MGRRGEGWVVVQGLFFLAIVFAPPVAGVVFPAWLRLLGGALFIAGAAFAVLGVLTLGRNLTPFPKPVPAGKMVTGGIYGLVRHPIYTGTIAVFLGTGLAVSNPVVLLLVALLFVFYDLKSRREERWLAEAYPEYAAYRRRVRKLVPWLY